MMDTAQHPGWIDKLSLWQRIALLFVTTVMAVSLAGFFVGFGIASYEHGHLLPRKPIGWLALGVAAGLSIVVYRIVRALFRMSWTQGMTSFDMRYTKMWLIVMLLGAALGVALVFATRNGDPRDVALVLSNGALSPSGAILLSAALVVLLGIAVILYHRAIDDHEERAYLWASQIAYYFLAIIIPIFWLLSRGGLVPALTAGGAMLMLLASFVIQGAVWAWFKFR